MNLQEMEIFPGNTAFIKVSWKSDCSYLLEIHLCLKTLTNSSTLLFSPWDPGLTELTSVSAVSSKDDCSASKSTGIH